MWLKKVIRLKKFLPGLLLIFVVLGGFKFITLVNFYRWQEKRRELFIKLLGIDMTKKLDLETVKEEKETKLERGLTRRLIKFKSSFNEEIPCYLFYHQGQKKREAILVASGHGKGIVETSGLEEGYQNSNALKLAQAGFVVLTCENRSEGKLQYFSSEEEISEQKDKRLYSLKEVKKYEDQQVLVKVKRKDLPDILGVNSYLGLILEDQRRAVDYLESLPFVNRKKIGAAGVSLGGEIVFYLAAIDKRIKSAVVMGWLTNWTELLDDEEDWIIPGIESHFPSMADIGLLIIPRYSLFHNGKREARITIAIGFPADVAKLIFDKINRYYFDALVPSRTEFYSEDVEHEFVNSLAIDFFKRNLEGKRMKWITKDLTHLFRHYIKKILVFPIRSI